MRANMKTKRTLKNKKTILPYLSRTPAFINPRTTHFASSWALFNAYFCAQRRLGVDGSLAFRRAKIPHAWAKILRLKYGRLGPEISLGIPLNRPQSPCA